MTYWITTGNECDVNVAEAIRLLAEKDEVQTICAYAESIKDGDALKTAMRSSKVWRRRVMRANQWCS